MISWTNLTSVTVNKDCLACQPRAGRCHKSSNYLGDVRMFVTQSDSSWKIDKRHPLVPFCISGYDKDFKGVN